MGDINVLELLQLSAALDIGQREQPIVQFSNDAPAKMGVSLFGGYDANLFASVGYRASGGLVPPAEPRKKGPEAQICTSPFSVAFTEDNLRVSEYPPSTQNATQRCFVDSSRCNFKLLQYQGHRL